MKPDNGVCPFRAYSVDELGEDGYPPIWHEQLKHEVRAAADHRCVRCAHPFRVGGGCSEWSPCDEQCRHRGPGRYRPGWSDLGENVGASGDVDPWSGETATPPDAPAGELVDGGIDVEAQWRILTVHHLDGDKANCRWWNLAALCQRCHLEIQGRVIMDRVWPHEHSNWFRPYVAGYYAWRYLGEEISRQEAEQRIDELLGLEIRQLALETT